MCVCDHELIINGRGSIIVNMASECGTCSSSLDTSLETEEKSFITSIDSLNVNTIIEAKDRYDNWYVTVLVSRKMGGVMIIKLSIVL